MIVFRENGATRHTVSPPVVFVLWSSGRLVRARCKLDQLDAATRLGDLARPGNRLEALKGRRKGQWSIRINDQWRICFKWPDGSPGPTEVEIVDYH